VCRGSLHGSERTLQHHALLSACVDKNQRCIQR
jgi:hypothetical protein